MGVHTQNEVKPLDKNRSGMALGEGAVCYVLTKKDKMQNYIAEISKIVLYNDNYNLTAPSPDGSAGKYILSQLTSEHIDSINCHATATITGDDAEISSLEDLPYSTYLYGMKSAVGHTMASSAGIEMAYSIAGLVNGWIPYTRSSNTAVESKHNIVLNDIVKKEISNFVKLSFGFGGGSAGILISKK
jgi:3-oxoacyl-(acyl-carrier-protein) synthase